jgi:hypothetical protein
MVKWIMGNKHTIKMLRNLNEKEVKVRKERKMLKQILRFRSTLVLILGLSLLNFGAFARADGDRGEKYRHDNFRYHHHDGRWYSHDEVVVQRGPSVRINL